ncbi:hypothetical protein QZH41_005254 [Actinostola sp. cb2023]|nr:hypothetical protein QZH41_005254 [Actinostola sp. cb2023]
MEVWQHIMDFTDRNAANVCRNQWNLNYLEVVGTAYEIPENIDDICKRIPKLKIETRTRYVKPRAKSTLGIHFKYTPPGRTQSSTKPFKDTVVSVKVVMPKVNDSTLVRNCICTCDRVQDRTRTEGDGDDDDITFDKLLDIVEHYDQGISKTSATVVRNVVRGYQGNITLNEYYVKKILVMLDSSDHIVLEAMLLLIHRLSRVSLNVKLLLEHGVLDDLIYLMLMGCTDELQTQAALCIAKLTEREEFSDWWMETMIISGTEALFDVLAAEEGTEDLRNAVLEAIVHLANNQKMASMLIDFGLENVIELTVCKFKTSEIKLCFFNVYETIVMERSILVFVAFDDVAWSLLWKASSFKMFAEDFFSTDSLHLSGQSRAFRNDSLSGHRTSRTTENAINENYLSSLRVLTNTLVAIETLIRVNDKEENDKEVTCSMETG